MFIFLQILAGNVKKKPRWPKVTPCTMRLEGGDGPYMTDKETEQEEKAAWGARGSAAELDLKRRQTQAGGEIHECVRCVAGRGGDGGGDVSIEEFVENCGGGGGGGWMRRSSSGVVGDLWLVSEVGDNCVGSNQFPPTEDRKVSILRASTHSLKKKKKHRQAPVNDKKQIQNKTK